MVSAKEHDTIDTADDLVLFAHIVRHGSLAAAGRALGMTKSRLSRRLAALEDKVGARLIQRDSRRLTITDIGERLLEHAHIMAAELDAANALVAGEGEPRGVLRISCPVTMSQFWLGPLLPRFRERYPLVRIRLDTTNRRVDLFGERIDVALRVRHRAEDEPNVVIRKLFDARDVLVINPEIWPQLVGITDLGPLAGVPTLSMADGADGDHWLLNDSDGNRHDFNHEPWLVSNDMGALRAAVLGGAGVALMPLMACVADVDSGALALLLPEWDVGQGTVQAAFASRRGLATAVRAFLDFLAEEGRLYHDARANPAIGTAGKP
ncbi:MAG: LysR family transcriptional regulator [Sphingomonas bacterium]|nr:LysR family transcriptional regulator [Sphingomonas bacterium]